MSFLFSRRPLDATALRPPLGISWTTLGLISVLALAAALRLSNLGAVGDANTYYTAAVESMLQSWRNFFFVAAEPGGSVSVDKPPVGLWLQALSASLLGVNGFAVVLPQILAGIASVALLFQLVRRSFGDAAGLLAALALAITPVAIAVERNNTPDATLILALLLAAWAFIKASESGRLGFLLLGAALVGVGFNIKMLQAFLPLPAFYALYLLGAEQSWRRKILNLALATALLSAVSLSWAIMVDLTPAEQRPYVGGSANNSALNLIFGYNGLQRLTGGGPGGGARPDAGPAPGDGQGFQPPAGAGPPGGPPTMGGARPDGARPGGDGAGGMFGTGQAGPLRLFQAGLAAQVSWLLPFGLIMLAAMAASRSWLRPHTALHRAVILWGGWLLTCVVFFSLAGFFHQYYLAMLGAPLAALVAIGAISLWRLRARRPARAALLLLAAAVVTLAFQIYAVALYETPGWWLAIPVGLGAAGSAALLAGLRPDGARLARLGFGLTLAALLVVPAVWSGLTTAYANTGSALTQAYGGSSGAGGMAQAAPGNAPASGGRQRLVDYLQANTQDISYLAVVPSSQGGADLVLATGRPVLYAGGFNGSDPVLDGAGLAELVESGEVRYVLWGSAGGRAGGDSGISSYLQAECSLVSDAGLSTPTGGPGMGGGPGEASSLYRCGG